MKPPSEPIALPPILGADEPISARHCRAARGLLDWSQQQLTDLAGVGVMTVKRLERGDAMHPEVVRSIRNVFEANGVVFLASPPLADDTDPSAGVVVHARSGPLRQEEASDDRVDRKAPAVKGRPPGPRRGQ